MIANEVKSTKKRKLVDYLALDKIALITVWNVMMR